MSFFDTLKDKFSKKKDGDRYLSGFNKTSDTMGKSSTRWRSASTASPRISSKN